MNLTCHCQNHCPGGESSTGTCTTSSGGSCFSSLQLSYDPVFRIYRETRSFGCFHSYESSVFQCRAYTSNPERPINITCCRESDLCNRYLIPEIILEEDLSVVKVPENNNNVLIPITAVACFIIFGLILGLLCRKRLSKFAKRLKLSKEEEEDELPTYSKTVPGIFNSSESSNFFFDSGSGDRLTGLKQVTIGLEIDLLKIIGKGTFGEVLLGSRKGEEVAVKMFTAASEESWIRERHIYEIIRQSHNKNILGFIGADVMSTGLDIVRILVTEYHELGSLYDYLNMNPVDLPIMLKMCYTIISGLVHLHEDIFANTRKPAIAHRDIKSKNILVKNANGECCISDFGLAVTCNSGRKMEGGMKARVGTTRYMAPEVLNGSMDLEWIHSFKAADIYSFSLVLWEIYRRLAIRFGEKWIDEVDYEAPYFEYVGNNPSVEEMHATVCLKNMRPELFNHPAEDAVLCDINEILIMCWDSEPRVRLSALRIKKNFADKIQFLSNED